MTKWELWGTPDDADERGHYYIRRDGRSVDLGDVVGELMEMEAEIERLRADLEREQTLRAAYKQLPEQYHRGMLELLVQAAFESAAISHGRAAELLECSVQDIRERGWVQGRKDEEIERLRNENVRLRRALCCISYSTCEDLADAERIAAKAIRKGNGVSDE